MEVSVIVQSPIKRGREQILKEKSLTNPYTLKLNSSPLLEIF